MPKGKATKAIHGRRDQQFNSVVYPVYTATTFAVEKSDDYYRYIAGDDDLIIYSRYGNPTVRNTEEKLAHLENAEAAVLFASGMGAITGTFFALLRPGDVVAAQRRLYGNSYVFLRDVAPRFGVTVHFLEDDGLYNLDKLVPDAKLVYFETPINPTVEVVSIRRVVTTARNIGAMTVIDNTFASPINQNPIDLGVDVVLHSATKYLGGHADIMAGVVMSSKEICKTVRGSLKMYGACVNPQDAAQLERSLKTLKVRVEGQNANALALAQFFTEDARVRGVYYPGLPDSPSHAVACEQMSGFGGMLTIELDTLNAAKQFCDSLQLAWNATSLGGVETLVSIPVLSSHTNMSDDELAAARVTPGMVRISVGLEDVEDLIEDFTNALAGV